MGGQSPGTLGQNDCMRDRADDFGHAKGLPPQVQRLGLEKDIFCGEICAMDSLQSSTVN